VQEKKRVLQAGTVTVQREETAGNRKGNLWQQKDEIAELLSTVMHKILTKLARRRRYKRKRMKRRAMKR
jgi:glutamate dehydrogenase/leucine dehydrogenase